MQCIGRIDMAVDRNLILFFDHMTYAGVLLVKVEMY